MYNGKEWERKPFRINGKCLLNGSSLGSALHGLYRRAKKSQEHKEVGKKSTYYQRVVTGGDMENDKDVLFISDAIKETKKLITEITELSNSYRVGDLANQE